VHLLNLLQSSTKILDADKSGRLELYKETDRKPDQTVLPSKQ
jgi:hypothetical protein